MHLLKVLVVLIVLVAVIEAQKGGTKTRQQPAPQKPQSVPSPPAGRKAPAPKPAPRRQPAPQRPQPQPQQPQEDEEGSAGNGIEDNEAIAEPPAVVPQTSFTCDDKPYQPGMYADMENECKSYHMCFDSRKESFLCGTGTMFNQEILSCDHEAKVNCANSPNYYEANTELGKPGAEPSNQQPAPSGQSGQKGGAVAPQPRPRVQKPQPQQPSKSSPRQQPQPQQPQAAKPFQDDEPETDEQPEEAPIPARPAPQPRPRPSKTSQPKAAPRPAPQPKKAPAPKKTPIVQSYDSDDESESSNVRRAYRARY